MSELKDILVEVINKLEGALVLLESKDEHLKKEIVEQLKVNFDNQKKTQPDILLDLIKKQNRPKLDIEIYDLVNLDYPNVFKSIKSVQNVLGRLVSDGLIFRNKYKQYHYKQKLEDKIFNTLKSAGDLLTYREVWVLMNKTEEQRKEKKTELNSVSPALSKMKSKGIISRTKDGRYYIKD